MSLCQLQTWVVETQLGLPKRLIKRDNQRPASETEVPPPVPFASLPRREDHKFRGRNSIAPRCLAMRHPN